MAGLASDSPGAHTWAMLSTLADRARRRIRCLRTGHLTYVRRGTAPALVCARCGRQTPLAA